MEQSEDFQKKISDFCFANLTSYLTTQNMLDYPAEFDQMEYPLFVTW